MGCLQRHPTYTQSTNRQNGTRGMGVPDAVSCSQICFRAPGTIHQCGTDDARIWRTSNCAALGELWCAAWRYCILTWTDRRQYKQTNATCMHMYVYIYMCVCTRTEHLDIRCVYTFFSVHACTHARVHACVCMFVCAYVCMYVRMHVCMYVCMYVFMYLCMNGCMHVCTDVCMHVFMHEWMHVCMHRRVYACIYVE